MCFVVSHGVCLTSFPSSLSFPYVLPVFTSITSNQVSSFLSLTHTHTLTYSNTTSKTPDGDFTGGREHSDGEGGVVSLRVKWGLRVWGSDFYEVTMRNGLDLCGWLLKRSRAIQQCRVTEYQSATAEWEIS